MDGQMNGHHKRMDERITGIANEQQRPSLVVRGGGGEMSDRMTGVEWWAVYSVSPKHRGGGGSVPRD